ncbi:unnamed protein product [Linum tenue]|uniref:RNase H type-1 domain-containing protein n=1 Tax=Linum tenue TaxID=586396 RepID=A0AAV0IQC9_9ROSI|nr:unnamed protein product [Linum tenue]
MSINTDGSVKQPGSLAAAGGLIRDWTGRCVDAFVENLGICTITRAEIKAAIRGRWLGGKAIAKCTFKWIPPLLSISSPPKFRPSTGTSIWSNNSRD